MEEKETYLFTREILKRANIGIWAIELEKDKEPRMFADEVMMNLLGIKKKKISPEQIYKAWYKNIDPAHVEEINKTIEKMKKGVHAEVQYPWNHPVEGITYVRCGGVLNKSYKDFYRLEGSHQDITQLVHFQKQTELKEKEIKEVKNDILTYSVITQSLCSDYENVFYVNIEDFSYKVFIANGKTNNLQVQMKGDDFFEDMKVNISKYVYMSDKRKLSDFIDKNNILPELKKRKTISIRYRHLKNKKPVFYQLSAVPSIEKDKNHYIFAVQNVANQVEKENEYTDRLRAASEMANTDGLTGIKNRLAYEKAEEIMNGEILKGIMNPFSVAVFDVNNLKIINDKFGHEAGDELLCDASKMICDFFSHSPVYRIGGDEFAVILIGADFFDRKTIISSLRKKIASNNIKQDGVIIASGLSDYDFNKDKLVEDVFSRADKQMYENKKKLKENKK